MLTYRWTENLSVNNDVLDLHHQELIDLLNKVYTTLFEQSSCDNNAAMVDRLFKYTQYHFTEEETYLKSHQFPEYEDHRQQHNLFISKLIDFRDKVFQSPEDASEELFMILSQWINNHIRISDCAYKHLGKAALHSR